MFVDRFVLSPNFPLQHFSHNPYTWHTSHTPNALDNKLGVSCVVDEHVEGAGEGALQRLVDVRVQGLEGTTVANLLE